MTYRNTFIPDTDYVNLRFHTQTNVGSFVCFILRNNVLKVQSFLMPLEPCPVLNTWRRIGDKDATVSHESV